MRRRGDAAAWRRCHKALESLWCAASTAAHRLCESGSAGEVSPRSAKPCRKPLSGEIRRCPVAGHAEAVRTLRDGGAPGVDFFYLFTLIPHVPEPGL
ncbi:hypothetical protein D3C87_1540990 [compost metagenome]